MLPVPINSDNDRLLSAMLLPPGSLFYVGPPRGTVPIPTGRYIQVPPGVRLIVPQLPRCPQTPDVIVRIMDTDILNEIKRVCDTRTL
ncbi:hypothetical protein APHAL10511_008134 [Amanita phalloides]|nr:hypothetical protein APHAL10511_008134 [Amanita phalloides]